MSGMAPRVVLFQGQRGAYSEEAARGMFPDAEVVALPTFREVFLRLQRESDAYACLPLENTTAGRVSDVQLLLPRFPVQIVREWFLPIRHQLLGVPQATRRTIRRVLSHPQALAQCAAFLEREGIEPVPFDDTAGAAAEVARREDPTIAAIASRAAGTYYGLKVLARNVQDEDHNTTRFIVLAPAPQPYPPLRRGARFLTALWFTLKSVPAALYKAIGGFATAALNLTKIESHLTGDRFSRAQFYIEVEGHPESSAMQHALRELSFFADEVRILGVFEAHAYRLRGHQEQAAP